LSPDQDWQAEFEKSLADRLKSGPAARGPDCPPLEEWGRFASGGLPQVRSMELIVHASECEACAELLAELSDETGASAQAVSPAPPEPWHTGMADRLGRSMEPTAGPRKIFRMRPVWLAAAAGIAMAAIVGGAWWVRYSQSPERVVASLAQDYSSQRPFEFRLSGADYGPIRVNRGNRAATRSARFLESQAEIARRLEANPGSPAWLRARARADLLEGQYGPAIDDLRHAQETAAADTEVLGDLAVAYLERADSEQHVPDIAVAIDLLSEALRRDPNNRTYRFNRALALERLPAPHEAADAWREFLRLETSGGWAEEAQEHLRRMEQLIHKQRGDAAPNETDLQPALVLAALHKHAPEEIEALSRAMIDQHGDPWIRDIVSEASRGSNAPALDLLLLADQAGARGEADDERELGGRAGRLLQAQNAPAGEVLAGYEEAHGAERGSHAEECQRVGQQILPEARRAGYRWLEARLDLTLAACLGMERKFEQAVQLTLDAGSIAATASYPATALMAVAWRATFLSNVGAYRDAMRLDRDGLMNYWGQDLPTSSAYILYFDMATAARGLGMAAATASLSREAPSESRDRGHGEIDARRGPVAIGSTGSFGARV
jgi:tetratricopeptide (TPR) repeat protein